LEFSTNNTTFVSQKKKKEKIGDKCCVEKKAGFFFSFFLEGGKKKWETATGCGVEGKNPIFNLNSKIPNSGEKKLDFRRTTLNSSKIQKLSSKI